VNRARGPQWPKPNYTPGLDYTEEQWGVLNATVIKAKAADPGIAHARPTGLSSRDRSHLLAFRRAMIAIFRTPPSKIGSRERKNFRRIAWLCRELRRAILRTADPIGNICESDVAVVMIGFAHPSLLLIWTTAKVRMRRTPIRAFFLFYTLLVTLWTQMGGEIKVSRNRRTRQLCGPLIKFIKAAANPVLGAATLRGGSLQELIEAARDNGIKPDNFSWSRRATMHLVRRLVDYTEEQWDAINAAVVKAKATHSGIARLRPAQLLFSDRRRLMALRNMYRALTGLARTPRSKVTSRERKNFRRIAWLCRELERAIGNVRERELGELMALLSRPSLHRVAFMAEAYESVYQNTAHDLGQRMRTPVGTVYTLLLELWTQIGGELRFSRNRRTRQICGR
jgi:hypothetical protein